MLPWDLFIVSDNVVSVSLISSGRRNGFTGNLQQIFCVFLPNPYVPAAVVQVAAGKQEKLTNKSAKVVDDITKDVSSLVETVKTRFADLGRALRPGDRGHPAREAPAAGA